MAYAPQPWAPVCSFYARGECTRGTDCPFKHETPAPPSAVAVAAPAKARTPPGSNAVVPLLRGGSGVSADSDEHNPSQDRFVGVRNEPASPPKDKPTSAISLSDGSSRSPPSTLSPRKSPPEEFARGNASTSSLLTQIIRAESASTIASAADGDGAGGGGSGGSGSAGGDDEPRKVSIEDFEVLYTIGDGLVGRVYQVRHTETGEIYAMKVIPKDLVAKEAMVTHTKAERNISISVNHPFVLDLKFALRTQSDLVLILEYMPGGDLAYHLRSARLDEDGVRFYAAELFLAVEYLHANNILHRDLKAANVLLDGWGHIRLTDFGFAKELSPAEVAEAHLAKTYCGTVSYMAPEMVRRVGHSFSADWWSYGVLVFEMLAGYRPFDARESDAILAAIVEAPLEFPQAASAEIRSLLAGLLDRDAVARFGPDQIRAHPFFAGIDWEAVLYCELDPPVTPYIDSDEGDAYVGNFPSSLIDETPPDISDLAMGLGTGASLSRSGVGSATARRRHGLDVDIGSFTYTAPAVADLLLAEGGYYYGDSDGGGDDNDGSNRNYYGSTEGSFDEPSGMAIPGRNRSGTSDDLFAFSP